MNDFFSGHGDPTEWTEARSRLETYLRALGLASPEQEERIIQRVMDRAAAQQPDHPEAGPLALTMNEIQGLTERWFAGVVPGRKHVAATGLVSLLAIDAAENWPGVFLADEIPPEFERALQTCEVRAAPDLSVSSMVPEPFANPLEEALPSPLGALARELAPVATKIAAVLLSGQSFWPGGRPR